MLLEASVVLACAMGCPGDTASDPPPVISVHDDNQRRAGETCRTIGVILGGKHRCVVLPALNGHDPACAPVFSIYDSSQERGQQVAFYVIDRLPRGGTGIVEQPEEAPPGGKIV